MTYELDSEAPIEPLFRQEHIIIVTYNGLKFFDYDLNPIEEDSDIFKHLKDEYYSGKDITYDHFDMGYTGWDIDDEEFGEDVQEIKINRPDTEETYPKFGLNIHIVNKKHHVIRSYLCDKWLTPTNVTLIKYTK